MISQETIAELESPNRGCPYILVARMRSEKEVCQEVLSVPGRYQLVYPQSPSKKDPSALKAKDPLTDGRRSVVCLNEDQARKDAADRGAILSSLREQLEKGDKALVGNKGYWRYLKTTCGRIEIDEHQVLAEARYDGGRVLRINTDVRAEEVALKYKQLWRVESLFRTLKSVLEIRPIYPRACPRCS
jgi:IS4 transposase